MRVGDRDDAFAGSAAGLNFRNVFFEVRELLFDYAGDLMQRLAVQRPVAAELVDTLDHAPGDNQDCRDGEQHHDERTQSARDMPIFQPVDDRVEEISEQHRDQKRDQNRRSPVTEGDHDSGGDDLATGGAGRGYFFFL